MTITLQPVKGTRDFYPAEMRLRNWLFDIWRETSRQFGFEEYDACVLESEDLYIRKAGDEITEQLYAFDDKGGRRLALRPEMTPSLARLVLQRKNALSFPLKWFAIPQCFRYERMTRGRKREHYQWNADVVGQAGQTAEVEVLSVLLMSLEKMGLSPEQIRVHLNDRRILNAILEHIGVPEALHLPVMVVMDKRDKISGEALDTQLSELGLEAEQVSRLNDFLRMETLQQIGEALGHAGHAGEAGFSGALGEMRRLMETLEAVGFGGYCQFDITVVRGLSYYTGTVFEIRDAGGKLRAICGGGRYDSLLSAFGGDPVPAIGFGFGDVVILELLAEVGLLPELTPEIDYVVIPFSKDQVPAALTVGQALRRAGFRADADFGFRKLKRALQRAGEIGARKAVLLMPEELERGELVVRDMAAREEKRVAVEAFLASPE
ncbi:MAG: histidine--tRNA ligase [SAR324 cluster bacterium]|nr:histidine--tRNA ligase [SAR324 cluster bacterium]